jgi:MFS family permease
MGLIYIFMANMRIEQTFIFLGFMSGFALTLANTIWVSLFHSNVRADIKGRVFGMMGLFFGIAQSISIFVSPIIVRTIGYQNFLVICGFFMIIYYGIVYSIPRRKVDFEYEV